MLTFEVVTEALSYFCLLTLMWSMLSLPSPLWNRNKGQEVGGKPSEMTEDWHMDEVFRDPVVYDILLFFPK